MTEFLLPRTDAGVVVQALLVVGLIAVALWRSRHRPDLRLLAVGIGLMAVAAMGLRAAH